MPQGDGVNERIRRIAVQRLESLERAGVRQLPRGQFAAVDVAAGNVAAGAESSAAQATTQPGNRDVMEARTADLQAALNVVQAEVAACTRCQELAGTRTQTVFGIGNPRARLCFFGEAPGADEDRLGEPFVGRAGKLLTDIIQKGMGLERSDVYIMNILKCRPPGNRNPNPDEVDNCREFFERQFEIINPEFICCLGAVAAQNLLETTVAVGRLRGKIHDYRGVKVVVTYHPSYLLRNPSAKKQTWEDIQMLMREMGLPLPQK